MNKLLLALLLLSLGALPASAQPTPTYVEVSDTSSLRELAASYAATFAALRNETSRELTLVLHRNERFFVLKDVRGFVANGSVLVATVGSQEAKYLFNPRDVVLITSSRSLRFDNPILLND